LLCLETRCKAASGVAQKRELLSQQMSNVVKLSAISALVEADFRGLLFLIRRHQILTLGLDLYRSFAVGRQKELSLLSHLQQERAQRNRAGGWLVIGSRASSNSRRYRSRGVPRNHGSLATRILLLDQAAAIL
jgi:hypothetical protein